MNYKILGLLGGIGPESTVDYYKMIISKFQERAGKNIYPHFIISNINMSEMLSYIKSGKLDMLIEFLTKEINVLEKSGADFGALASNTPHIVFSELQKKVSLPLISIVNACMQYVRKKNIHKVGLFGTMSTMDGGFYQSTANEFSIKVITPDKSSMDFINQIYFDELVKGIIKDDTKRILIETAEKMRVDNGIEGLILGGTELPLILEQNDFDNIILFNTSQIHVEKIIEKMFE